MSTTPGHEKVAIGISSNFLFTPELNALLREQRLIAKRVGVMGTEGQIGSEVENETGMWRRPKLGSGMFVDVELVKEAGFTRNLGGALLSGFKWPGRLLHGAGSLLASKPGMIASGVGTAAAGLASVPLAGGLLASTFAATPVLAPLALGALGAKGVGMAARGVGRLMRGAGNLGEKVVKDSVKEVAERKAARAAVGKAKGLARQGMKSGPGLWSQATDWVGANPLAAAGAGAGAYLAANRLLSRDRGPQIMSSSPYYKQGSLRSLGMVKEANLLGESLSGLGKTLRWPFEGPGRVLSFIGGHAPTLGRRMISPKNMLLGETLGLGSHLMGADALITMGLIPASALGTVAFGMASPLVTGAGLVAGAPVVSGLGAALQLAGAPGRALERLGLGISERATAPQVIEILTKSAGSHYSDHRSNHMFLNTELVKEAKSIGLDLDLLKEAGWIGSVLERGGNKLFRWGAHTDATFKPLGGGIRKAIGGSLERLGHRAQMSPTMGQIAAKIPGVSGLYRRAAPVSWAGSKGVGEATLASIKRTGVPRSQVSKTLGSMQKRKADFSSLTPQSFGKARAKAFPAQAPTAAPTASPTGGGKPKAKYTLRNAKRNPANAPTNAGGGPGAQPGAQPGAMSRMSGWFKGLEPWQQTAFGLGAMYTAPRLIDSAFGSHGGQTIVANDQSGSSHVKLSSAIPGRALAGGRMFVDTELVKVAFPSEGGLVKEALDPVTGLLGLGMFGAAKGIGALRNYFAPGKRLARRMSGGAIADLVEQEAKRTGVASSEIWKNLQKETQGNFKTFGGLDPLLSKGDKSNITSEWARKRGLDPLMPELAKGQQGGIRAMTRNIHPAYMVGGGVLGAHLLSRDNQQQPMIIH